MAERVRSVAGDGFSAPASHPGLQAADYCTWSVYRKYQRGDLRSYDLIRAFIRSELDVFAEESVTYY